MNRTRTLTALLLTGGLAVGGAATLDPATSGASPAASCSPHVRTYHPPAGTGDPFGISPGPGGIWFGDGGTVDAIRQGHISTFPVPDASTAGVHWIAADPANAKQVWYTDVNNGRIGTMSTRGHAVSYQIPAGPGGTIASPNALLVSPHFVWFNDQVNDRIGRLNRASGYMRFFDAPDSGDPLGLVRGKDGDIYTVERSAARIARLDPHTGLWTQWSLPSGSFPNRITVDPKGNLWFTELLGRKIGEIDTSGHLTQYPIAGGPVGIVYHRGRLYTALYNSGQLAVLDLHGHVLRKVTLPGATAVLQVTALNSDVWVGDFGSQRVYRVTTC